MHTQRVVRETASVVSEVEKTNLFAWKLPRSPLCANPRAQVMGEMVKAGERTRDRFAMMTLASPTAHMRCQPLSVQGRGWISVGPQGRCCEMPTEGPMSPPLVRAWGGGTGGRAGSNEDRTSPAPARAGDEGNRGLPWPAADATARPKKTMVDPVPGTL